MKIQIMGGKFAWGVRSINIWKQKGCWHLTLQCFALLPQVNFPANNLNFHWRWRRWDQIQPIVLILFYFRKFWQLQFNEFFLSQTIASTTKCSWPVHRCKTIWKSCFIYSTSWRLLSSTVLRHFKANLPTLPRKNKSEHCTIF